MFSVIVRALVAGALVVGFTGSAAVWAAASGSATVSTSAATSGGDVIRAGVCTGRRTTKIKLSPDNGRIEVQFEVDSNRAGQVWRVRVFHDGIRIFRGLRVTKAPSGSFELRLLARDRLGVDGFRARARNLGNGELCGAHAAI